MTQREIASNARKIRKELDAVDKLRDALWSADADICESCSHPKVVVLNSYYGGSRSYDYDDWRSERRLCLVCGATEVGTDKVFKHLHKPFARFEINGNEPNHPFANDGVLRMPMEKAERYAREAGYKVL